LDLDLRIVDLDLDLDLAVAGLVISLIISFPLLQFSIRIFCLLPASEPLLPVSGTSAVPGGMKPTIFILRKVQRRPRTDDKEINK